jgi:hypothetical protein
MAKLPPERLAAALRANLKRRKQSQAVVAPQDPTKIHKKIVEKTAAPPPSPSAKT